VILNLRLGPLRRHSKASLSLQDRDDLRPARTVCPCPMNQEYRFDSRGDCLRCRANDGNEDRKKSGTCGQQISNISRYLHYRLHFGRKICTQLEISLKARANQARADKSGLCGQSHICCSVTSERSFDNKTLLGENHHKLAVHAG
jgi:hypothetical protein